MNVSKQQFWTLSWIRFTLSRREPSVVVFRIILPLIFIIVGAALSRFLSNPSAASTPRRFQFTPGHYVKLNQHVPEPFRDLSKRNPDFFYGLSPGK